MLSLVSPGASFTIDAYFYNSDNTSFAATVPVTYNIRDFNGNLVLNGTAAQDVVNTARWYSTVTMPANVPLGSPEQKYSLNWLAINAATSKTSTELFQVMPTQDYTFIENDKVVLEMCSIGDSLILPSSAVITALSVNIVDQTGNSVYTNPSVSITPISLYDKNVYPLITPAIPTMLADNLGMRPYIVQWTYSIGGIPQFPEFHFIYIINSQMLLAMNDLRRMIDKARNDDVSPALRYSDVDLVQYIQLGMQRLNNCPPQFSYWDIRTIPSGFQGLLTYASAYEALNAQAIAEGQSAFDFSGQSVNLSVDRTSSIESALSRIDAYLEANLSRSKKLYARNGSGTGVSAGVLGLSVGPNINRIANAQMFLDHMRLMGASGGQVF